MKSRSSVLWGIAIIVIGLIFLGNNLNIWNVDVFFDGWWTLFIIIPSFLGLFKREDFFSSSVGLIIGVLFLLAAQDLIDWSIVGKVFIPVLLIMIGLSLIFKSTSKPIKRKNNKGIPQHIGVFAGCEEKVNDDFNGADCIAVFGGVDLDLRDAIIKEDVVIECVSVFGGIDIKLPDNVIVKTSGVPIFGGIENKVRQPKKEKCPTIYINYVCVFAGIDVG